MQLRIRVDATLKKPLYRQLVDALAEQIRDGSLEGGYQLPSVRELALELRINPNTVARAYRELENENLATSRPGKGVFVRDSPPTLDAALPPELELALQQIVEMAHQAGIPIDLLLTEMQRRIRLLSKPGDKT